MSHIVGDDWSTPDVAHLPTDAIRFEPCYQPGDDNVKERLESLWHQAASISEDIAQTTYGPDAQDGDTLSFLTIKEVYQGNLKPNRHLLVSVITHVICSIIIEKLLLRRWQTIKEEHRSILEYMYERQLELNLDILERWRANLFTIMVQEHHITDNEIRLTAQDFTSVVAKTLKVNITVGIHYTSFLRLVQDGLALAKELQLTPAKYEFYAAIDDAEFDEHFMESVNCQGTETASKIAFVAFPGVVRTTDCNELVLEQPCILCKPKVFLERFVDMLPPAIEFASERISADHQTNYYTESEMEETDLGTGFSSITGAQKLRCVFFSGSQVSLLEPVRQAPKVHICSSIEELTEALGCCLLVDHVSAQSGYLQLKRQFLHNLSVLPNIYIFLLIRSTKYVKRETISSAEFDRDKLTAYEDLLDKYGDTFVSRIDTGTEYVAVYSIQLVASGAKRQKLIKLLSALQDHDFNVDKRIWSQLVNSRELYIDFHEIQTKISEENTKDTNGLLDILDVYSHAIEVVSHQENWPAIISVAYTGYEKLTEGDTLFPNLASIRAELFGSKAPLDSGKNLPGLIGICSRLHSQLNSIENLLRIYRFWDVHWQDVSLENEYSVKTSQVESLESTIQSLVGLFRSSKALASYKQTCNANIVDMSMLGKRPQLRIIFFVDQSQTILTDARLTRAIYDCASLSTLDISGVNHIRNITVKYAAVSERRERRRYGLQKDLVAPGASWSLTLQPVERIEKLEKIARYKGLPGILKEKSSLPRDAVTFVRLTTSQNSSIEVGVKTEGTKPEISNFGSGRFLVRLEADVDRCTHCITSINPILGSFEAAEWL